MMKFSFILSLSICSVCVTGQSGPYVQKLYAYKEVLSGAPANYLVYVEVPKSDTPIWNSAVIRNDIYAVHPTIIEQSSMVVGERKRDNRLIKINPAPGNSLWKLEFDLTGEKDTSAANTTEETVILKGMLKNRKISSTVTGIVEMASP